MRLQGREFSAEFAASLFASPDASNLNSSMGLNTNFRMSHRQSVQQALFLTTRIFSRVSQVRAAQLMKAPPAASTTLALRLASMNRSSHSATSSGEISDLPLTLANMLLGVNNCKA